ncbi:MAG TPA: helix-turn-helix domain-containing protein [Terracidiphilus sp.]|nr:helix-turn-helix domain-containing protein [Terracidiphilus sp.]
MRRTLRDLADARRELLEIQQEFIRLQKRIDAVRDCVTDSLTRIFGEERPAISALAEEEFIEKIADRVAARLGTQPAATRKMDNRYVREKEAATFLGVSVMTLRAWRSRVGRDHPPVTKVGGMVMYSKKALEEFMEERTVGRR